MTNSTPRGKQDAGNLLCKHMKQAVVACCAALGASALFGAEVAPESGDWSGDRTVSADDVFVLDVSEGSTKAYSGKISGAGKVRKIGCGVLQLTGDNSGFTGEWLVATGRVDVASAANLGTSSSVKIWAEPNKHTGILCINASANQTFPNPIRIMGPGAGYSLDGGTDAARYRQIHSTGKTITLTGEITAEAGCQRFWITSHAGNLTVSRINAPGVDVYPANNGEMHLKYVRAKTIGGPICTKNLYPATGSVYYCATLFFDADADVECDEIAVNYVCPKLYRANLFPKAGGGWAVFNLSRFCNDTGNSILDVNGYNQTFDRMISAVRDPRYRGQSGKSCTGGRLRSVAAATVTLKGTADAATAVDVYGNVSLVWDPVDDYTQTFTNSESGTTGSIAVRRGTFELAGVTTFSNVTAVVVDEGATFVNNSTATGSLDNVASVTVGTNAVFDSRSTLQTFNGTTAITLRLAADAELYLPTNETVSVADIYVDGERLPGGSYAAGGTRTIPQLKSGTVMAMIRPGDGDLFTWSGAGADKLLTTGDNWEGEVKPDFTGLLAAARFGTGGDEALIPDGSKIAYLEFSRPFALRPASSGAAFQLNGGLTVEGANDVVIESGVDIGFSQQWTLGTGKLALSGRLTGAAGATVSVRGTGDEISFSGGGSTYPGSIAFCDAPNVKASGTNPFGGAGGCVSWSNVVSKAQTMSFSNFSTEKDVLIHSTAADYDKLVVTEGDAEFKGSFTSTRSVHFEARENTRLIFSGPSAYIKATFVPQGKGDVFVNAPLTAIMIQMESDLISFGAKGNVISHAVGVNLEYLGSRVDGMLRFAVDDAFDDQTALTLFNEPGKQGTVDLCGHSQTFGTLTMLTKSNRQPEKFVITNSGERATLHIVQNTDRIASNGAPPAWIAGRIRGPIDFWKSGVASTVVSNHIEAVGELKVTHAGIVFAKDDGSWRNATSVVIADDPTEEIKAGEEPFVEIRSDNALGRRADLTISGAGTLRIAAGVRQHVKSCTAGGVTLGAGTWRHGATYSEANHTTPYVTGDGVLSVRGGAVLVIR